MGCLIELFLFISEMRTKKKPIRTVEVKPDRDTTITLTLSEREESKSGYTWKTYLVQGWQEDGKWKRRKFKKLRDADAFIDQKQVELKNAAGAKHFLTTHLTEEQAREAEDAFYRLGDRYDLREAVDFFLAHYCNPDFKIAMKDAKNRFLGAKENVIRPRSIRQLDSTLTRFEKFVENRHVHEVTSADIERFLKSIRAKDGVNRASKKTWNNYRADLSSFFSWCCDGVNGWIGSNPVKRVAHYTPKQIREDRSSEEPEILTTKVAEKLMSYVADYSDGKMVRYFALALFAGIRPGPEGELAKLATHPDRDKLIDLKRGVITIPAKVSKVREKREILIRPNLKAWLQKSSSEILPTNHDRMIKKIRKDNSLSHDVLRHSFISYHVAAFRSIGEAALEGGNSESIIKKHYLNLASVSEGQLFWGIIPGGQPKEDAHEMRVA